MEAIAIPIKAKRFGEVKSIRGLAIVKRRFKYLTTPEELSEALRGVDLNLLYNLVNPKEDSLESHLAILTDGPFLMELDKRYSNSALRTYSRYFITSLIRQKVQKEEVRQLIDQVYNNLKGDAYTTELHRKILNLQLVPNQIAQNRHLAPNLPAILRGLFHLTFRHPVEFESIQAYNSRDVKYL